jgi:hypothetical protein
MKFRHAAALGLVGWYLMRPANLSGRCRDYHEKLTRISRAMKVADPATFARSNSARRTAKSSSSTSAIAGLRFQTGGNE